jgi:hypothetical protein
MLVYNVNPDPEGYGHAFISWGMKKEPILQMGTDKIILIYVCDKPFMVRFPDRSEWKDGFQLEEKQGSLVHSSETNECIKAGMYGYDRRKRFSFSLGQYTTAFQAEVYALMACAVENIHRGHKNRNIIFLSES